MYKRDTNIKTENERKLESHQIGAAQPGDNSSNENTGMRAAKRKDDVVKQRKTTMTRPDESETATAEQQQPNNDFETDRKTGIQNTNSKRTRNSLLLDLKNM